MKPDAIGVCPGHTGEIVYWRGGRDFIKTVSKTIFFDNPCFLASPPIKDDDGRWVNKILTAS